MKFQSPKRALDYVTPNFREITLNYQKLPKITLNYAKLL